MKQVIYKYELGFMSWLSTHELPRGTEILSVQAQGDKIMMWAKHDHDATEFETRTFCIQGTGAPFEDGMTYLGMVQVQGFVWHVFELRDLTLPQEPEEITSETDTLGGAMRSRIESGAAFAFVGPPKAWFHFPEDHGGNRIVYETFAFGSEPDMSVDELSREATETLRTAIKRSGKRLALVWRQLPTLEPRSNEWDSGWHFRCRFALINEDGKQVKLSDLAKSEGDGVTMIAKGE